MFVWLVFSLFLMGPSGTTLSGASLRSFGHWTGRRLELKYILMRDARATLTDSASAAGRSVNTIRVRISRLVQLGVIKKFMAFVDPKIFGYNYVVVCMVNVVPGKLDYATNFLGLLTRLSLFMRLLASMISALLDFSGMKNTILSS